MMKQTTSPTILAFLLAVLLLLGGCQSSAPEPVSPSQPISSQPEISLPERSVPETEPEPPSPPESEEILPQPHGDFVWEVLGGQSRIYLMGTMHLVQPDYNLSQAVVDLLDSCDALAVESDVDDMELLEALMEYMEYQDGTTLFDHLSERGQEHVRNLCAEYGISPLLLASYRPMTVSSLFTYLPAPLGGFESDGVDNLLLNRARSQGKTILELEDALVVYQRFNSLDDDTQERVHILGLPFMEEMVEQLEELYQSYLTGDEERMLELFNEEEDDLGGDGLPIEFEEKDDLYEDYMLYLRNREMTASILEYLETPGRDVFVAAGLAHFLDEGSIVPLLEEAGYQVVRLELPDTPSQERGRSEDFLLPEQAA